MYSRTRLAPAIPVILLLSSTLLGGCAKFGLFELLPPRNPLRVSGGETACLEDAGTSLAEYFDGTATPASASTTVRPPTAVDSGSYNLKKSA